MSWLPKVTLKMTQPASNVRIFRAMCEQNLIPATVDDADTLNRWSLNGAECHVTFRWVSDPENRAPDAEDWKSLYGVELVDFTRVVINEPR